MSVESLEDHGIYLNREGTPDSLSSCPVILKDFFNLILSIQSIQWDLFGGTMAPEHCLQPTPVMQYESELKLEADALSRACLDPKRVDEKEDAWVEALKPIVFYRFSREDEEVYKRTRHHHCFVCGKHFPLRSRPLLNNQGQRSFEKQLRGVYGAEKESDNADVCTLHLNISKFDAAKLKYLGYDSEGEKIPDLTIGLLAWTQDAWHAPPSMEPSTLDSILEDRLVKSFRRDTLKRLEERGFLKPIFAYPAPRRGVHVRRVINSFTTFPFAVWEAKRALEHDAVVQNSLKVKMILEWQQDIAMRAKIAWEPLVFHFTSVGSEWKLYACHIQPLRRRRTYCFRLLWSGDCANKTKALQLLYLVDMIALWGEWQYRPFAAASIRIFKKQSRQKLLRNPLDSSLLRFQKKIDPRNFRSLQSQDICPNGTERISISLKRAGTNTSIEEVNQQLVQGLRFLSLETYYIPEKDGFIWLMHRQLRGYDLIVVRVSTAGKVLPAMVIFNASNWSSADFKRIAYEERARMPPNVDIDFRYSEDRTSGLNKCFDPKKGHCTMPEIQFCAILPLKRKSRALHESSAQNKFKALEQLLGLRRLIKAAEDAMELWCVCQGDGTGSMILCDSTKCAIGWYHNECVGLNDDYKADDWFCPTCKENSTTGLPITKYDNVEFEVGVREASDMRIQRARSLGRVWNNHCWPDPRDVTDLMFRQIACEIEMDVSPQKVVDTVACLEAGRHDATTRCRAVLRNDPFNSTEIRHRFRETSSP